MSQSGRPLLSNVYNQKAYFSGIGGIIFLCNGMNISGRRWTTGLVAAVLQEWLIQRTYGTTDETLGEDIFYTVRLSVIRDRTDKVS
jgi:hypothetical protein